MLSSQFTRARGTRARPLHHSIVVLALALAASQAGAAGLSLVEALELAQQAAPTIRAGDAALGGAAAARPAATTLPDPRLSVGIENLPANGPDRFTTRDTATMQRLALMQEVPNRAKRDARALVADARIERERTALALARWAVRRDAALAWVATYYAERRLALMDELERENQLAQQTLPARIAAGAAQSAESTMARQEALASADRRDDVARDVRRARADLRRWVGARADEPLVGEPPALTVQPDMVRAGLHQYAELTPFAPMRAMASAELAEADAEKRGDWSWEVAYGRRPRYDDMVSFQINFDLPWQREQRQQPAVDAKRRELERIEAEREDMQRRLGAEIDAMLAELKALDAQLARATGPAQALATERVELSLAGYRAGRTDLGAVLTARAQAIDVRLRAIDLEAQRSALRVRLTNLTAE